MINIYVTGNGIATVCLIFYCKLGTYPEWFYVLHYQPDKQPGVECWLLGVSPFCHHVSLVPKFVWDDLLWDPISMGSLFGLISSVAQCLKSTQISCHLPLVHPQRGGTGTRRSNASTRRRECCQSQPQYCPRWRLLLDPTSHPPLIWWGSWGRLELHDNPRSNCTSPRMTFACDACYLSWCC